MNGQQQDTMQTLHLTTHEMRLMLYALTTANVIADMDNDSGMDTQRSCFAATPRWVGKDMVRTAMESVESSLGLNR